MHKQDDWGLSVSATQDGMVQAFKSVRERADNLLQFNKIIWYGGATYLEAACEQVVVHENSIQSGTVLGKSQITCIRQ